jgi:hypothetical protein
MGNLGRATYEHTTNMMWPWSFNQCDRKMQPAQEISACAETKHWDLHAGQGRGATEIDIVEAMPGKAAVKEGDLGVGLPYMSTTLQVCGWVGGWVWVGVGGWVFELVFFGLY